MANGIGFCGRDCLERTIARETRGAFPSNYDRQLGEHGDDPSPRKRMKWSDG